MKLTYHRKGDYLFPNLICEEEPISYGKYGMLRRTYLKDNKQALYQSLLFSGKLDAHLKEIDETANERVENIMKIMTKSHGITEALKAADPMLWAVKMNSIQKCAEETVLSELVYS